MDIIDTLKSLGQENPVWKLSISAAKRIATELQEGDYPLVVLPIRDVVESGTRIPGRRPTFCLSEKKLIMAHQPGILSSSVCHSWLRADIVELSDYDDRSFTFRTSDGHPVTLRGMVRGRHVEEMTQRLTRPSRPSPFNYRFQDLSLKSECVRRLSDMSPHAVPIKKVPRKIPQTNPTPPDKFFSNPDESDLTGPFRPFAATS
jgi:hypothetical protein